MELREIINEAVAAAFEAGRLQAAGTAADAFKAAEQRMYALRALGTKTERDKRRLAEMRALGPREKSGSLLRLRRSSYRVDPEAMFDALVMDLESRITADEHEIATVWAAMEEFRQDPFFGAVVGKYVHRLDDGDIAAELGCGATQVWKQRVRIVRDIAIMLYGAAAVV